VENNQGEIDEITTKQGIEQAYMDENKLKFLQTCNTPCMQEPLCSLLGKYGDMEFSQSILSGQCIPPPSTPQYTRESFQQLQSATLITGVPTRNSISLDTFQSGWRKMNEHTSSDISGLLFGHLKACATRDFTFLIQILTFPPPIPSRLFTRQLVLWLMIQKKDKVNLMSMTQI
jgi:hypothetical protein